MYFHEFLLREIHHLSKAFHRLPPSTSSSGADFINSNANLSLTRPGRESKTDFLANHHPTL